MIIMSIDFGKARTGLALCDKGEMLAFPLEVIEEKNAEILCEKIAKKISENKVEKAVFGLPKNMDGSLGESAQRVRQIAEILKSKTNVPIDFWDERQTTVSAHSYLNATNTRGKKRKSIIDAVSAVIILENYLNYRKSAKNYL